MLAIELAHSSPYHPYIASDDPDSLSSVVDIPDSQIPTLAPSGLRRRRSSSPLGSATAGVTLPTREAAILPGRSDSRSPSPKRRRLATMRPDGIKTENGFSEASNGSFPSTPRKVGLNGSSSNGSSHTNGSRKPSSTYYGHNREEVSRILIQSLYELGYTDSASKLISESGNEMLFYLRQQKFLELLEARDLASALGVLRQELTPLNFDVERLHALSSLLMCPTEILHEQAGWDGPVSSSRERLLGELSKSISPSVMIPQHRLAHLLDHVKHTQINNCLYHNTAEPPSLYSDHMCDRNDFPLEVSARLSHHSDEVWYCEFSHDGTKLVTAGKDHHVLIYDTSDFSVLKRLTDHEEGVAFASWSPDDSKLITCSQDKKARVWSVETGVCLLTINHHRQPVTAAAWAADGESFVTASLDAESQLRHWSMRGQPLHSWKGGFRVQDCAISADGRRLVAADTEAKIHVYNFITYEEEYSLPLPSKPTSVAISQDSLHVLINLAEGEIQLVNMETTALVRQFRGQKQGEFVIRSTFGGAAENFIVSGSEDSKVYIWHKENGNLVETLEGHEKGCVNSISWNPRDPGMFASAGDDESVRM
ncbi:hypothetical protein PENANT_c043G08755 [Penicillium antarcticum]|uniref:Protein FYV10 n=1 Tax=Penicillium antarcticum TaxID=416450 RepID=A0A1V6PSX4_9EURO|nr:hypothetical protein PENANT_c043G08755 [Penicillium antarcticum]